MPAYRNSNRLSILWLGLSLLAVATTFGGIFFLIARFPDAGIGWGLLPAAWLLLFILIGLHHMSRAENLRRNRICQALEAAGFTAETPPARDRAHIMFDSAAHLVRHLDLRNGAEGLQWIAIRLPGHFFFEHEWVLSMGRALTIHRRTALVFQVNRSELPGSLLGDGPWFATHRPKLIGERRRIKRLADPIRTGHSAFDRRWVSIGSPTTAASFLTEKVRRLLERSPRGESWIIGHGFVCCSFQGSFDAPMLQRMWDHARSVLECTTPEGPSPA